MKKINHLLILVLIGAIVLTNTHVQAESHKKTTGFQKLKQTKANIKGMWFCLRNQNECSQQEVAKAKRWLVATPTAVIVATLTAIGIVVTAHSVNKQQKSITKENEKNREDNPQYTQPSRQQRLALRSASEGLSKKVNLTCKNIIDILKYNFTKKEKALNAFRNQYGHDRTETLKGRIENCATKW